jgi:hypothetical protein
VDVALPFTSIQIRRKMHSQTKVLLEAEYDPPNPNTVELTLTILAEKTCDRLVPTLPRGNTRLERSAFPQFHRAVSVPSTRERRIRHSHAGAWERELRPFLLAS